MRRLLPLLIIASLLLTGCASKLMTKVLDETTPVLDENTACITFYRPSLFGSMIQAPIAEATNNDLKVVGIASYKTKIRYLVPSGKHEFVVGGESGYTLNAEVSPKKFYYVYVRPCLGWWKARFDLIAIKPEELAKEESNIKKCRLVVPTEAAQNWFVNNKEHMTSQLENGRKYLSKRTSEKQDKFTLFPSDGVDILY